MKKSLSIILCVLMVAFSLCSCKFVKSDPADSSESTVAAQKADGKSKKSDRTAVDEKESSKESSEEETVYVTDKNGKIVTNKDGSKKTEKKTSGESITIYVTDKNGEYVTNKDGTPKTEKLDLEKMEKELEKQFEEQSKKSTTKKAGTNQSPVEEMKGSEEDLLPDGSKAKDTTLVKTIIEPVIKTGTYTVKGKIKAEGQSMSASVAFRNSKDYSVEVSLMGISLRMFSNGGKYYMAFPSMKMYSEISAQDAGDMSIDDITGSFKEKGAKYVKTTTVKSGKTTYTCEEYETSTGTTKYYFNSDKEWKRMEVVSKDGTIMVWEITTFSKTADSKLFEVNKLWKKSAELAQMFG